MFLRKQAFEYRALIIPLVAAILILTNLLYPILTVAILWAAASFSIYWKRFTHLSLGFELNSFATILMSFAYGPIAGIATALITNATGYWLNGRLCFYMFVPMISGCLVALIAPAFKGLGIATGGIILLLIFNVVLHAIYLALGNKPSNSALSFSVNMAVNSFLFQTVAALVLMNL